MLIDQLVAKEGWHQIVEEGRRYIVVNEEKYPYIHPVAIHLKLYRSLTNPEMKFFHMKAAHDYLWPSTEWHYWTEERFRAHCEGWTYISLAGGGNIAKSYDVAKIGGIFWAANPQHRNVTIASVTLTSLQKRVWGYLTRAFKNLAVPLPYKYYRAAPAKILYEEQKQEGSQNRFKVEDDTLHGIFSVTAKRSDDESTISTWIGQHPDDAMLVILDEGTDMPLALIKMLPNLNTKAGKFQLIIIGNSCDKFDLHGSLSTPKDGWESVNFDEVSRWETTQDNGICLYFNPYNSPAIHEADPAKKARLSEFLITEPEIEQKKKEYGGENSDGFWRFVKGLWRTESVGLTVLTDKLMKEYNPYRRAHWSGLYPLRMTAGLDPAFSTGGDNCILQLAILGHTVSGDIVLDYGGDEMQYTIRINPISNDSAELQIAKKVKEILDYWRIPLSHLAIDATGQGRALGEVIRLYMKTLEQPFKIYSTQTGMKAANSFDVVIKTTYELWSILREFMQRHQVCGVGITAATQLVSRLIIKKNGKFLLEPKPDFKTRMNAVMPSLARSPDEADACALALQAAILKFGFALGQKRDTNVPDFANSKLRALHAERMKLEQARAAMSNRIGTTPPRATFGGSLEDYALKRRGF